MSYNVRHLVPVTGHSGDGVSYLDSLADYMEEWVRRAPEIETYLLWCGATVAAEAVAAAKVAALAVVGAASVASVSSRVHQFCETPVRFL